MSLSAEEINQKWEEFKVNFKRNFTDDDEEKMRKELFAKSLVLIEEHNEKYKQGIVTSTMGINHFADRTPEERAQVCGAKPPKK